jgi:hypothetical protein
MGMYIGPQIICYLKAIICLVANDVFCTYSSSLQLVIEAGVGIAVLVRFFVNKIGMEYEIIDRLGNGFSRPPFAAVVVSLLLWFYSISKLDIAPGHH